MVDFAEKEYAGLLMAQRERPLLTHLRSSSSGSPYKAVRRKR